jgi:sugar phosphate isomerase/epimerase
VTSSLDHTSHIKPHVHVPYDKLDQYLSFIIEEQLNLEIYFGSQSCDSLQKSDMEELRSRLEHNPRLSIHAPFMDLSPGAVDLKVREVTTRRFSDVLDYAGILNPEIIVFHSGYEKWKYARRVDLWLEGSIETWKPVKERAADMGVKIAIENIFEDEPDNLVLLMKEMASEHFGLCFDTGHFNLFSQLPLSDWLRVTRPYIKELHLHDNARYADQHLALGDGDFDFKTLFSELKGINCVYTIEAHSVESVKLSLERLPTYLANSNQ